MTDEKTASQASKTVKATTPGFSGLSESAAVAQCPAGWTCTGGSVEKGHPDQSVASSRKTSDGTGWAGSIVGGPSGGTAVVHATCVKDEDDGKDSSGGDKD